MPGTNHRNTTAHIDELEEAREELRQALENGARLGAAATQAKQKQEEAEANRAELEEQLEAQRHNGSGSRAFPVPKTSTNMLLALSAVAILWSIAYGVHLGEAKSVSEAYSLGLWYAGFRLAHVRLFVLYSIALFQRSGLKRFAISYAVWIAGWAITVGVTLSGFDPGSLFEDPLKFNVLAMQMLVPTEWWSFPRSASRDVIRNSLFFFAVLVDLNRNLSTAAGFCSSCNPITGHIGSVIERTK